MNTEIKSDPGKQQVPAATGTASQPTDPEFTDAEQQGSGWAPNRSRRAIIIFGLVILAGVLTVLYAWGLPPFRSGNVTTDNAYVRGQTTIISPQVTGYVTAVNVRDFADVRKGAVLVTIDDRIYRARVAQGAANIAAQTATLDNALQNQRSGEAQVRLQDAAVANARAQLVRARADMARVDDLVSEGSVSRRERDQTLAALRQAETAVQQAQAQRAIAVEQVRSVDVGRGGLRAQVDNASAARDLARVDLDNTIIRAPRDGRLSEVAVRVGQLVSPGTQLMYLVPTEHWVVANFKEAQTADIRVGQKATLQVDAFKGASLTGVVERVSPAAGSEFSVIRPDTGAGNFVKVPQRIAVRIRIDPNQELARRLGPGMSVVATVHTRKQ
ncbi:HlyD family secretion protein [Sphingobium cloacae]|uniref:Secretion protein HlyD family protein n=1 Tax=Sphingobium cloacae TaxID=120107 RepID=A0A1E1F0T6_9SPHN|nr:HlyD family secretion protein [Sphingobium cloacae]BAV64124.1 secretion protein HlyD family protein [Sphingobium cloacae]